jgi:hypothetical protein
LWSSVMKGTNFNGSSSPNSILMSVTMPLAPTIVHHPHITNLPSHGDLMTQDHQHLFFIFFSQQFCEKICHPKKILNCGNSFF